MKKLKNDDKFANKNLQPKSNFESDDEDFQSLEQARKNILKTIAQNGSGNYRDWGKEIVAKGSSKKPESASDSGSSDDSSNRSVFVSSDSERDVNHSSPQRGYKVRDQQLHKVAFNLAPEMTTEHSGSSLKLL